MILIGFCSNLSYLRFFELFGFRESIKPKAPRISSKSLYIKIFGSDPDCCFAATYMMQSLIDYDNS